LLANKPAFGNTLRHCRDETLSASIHTFQDITLANRLFSTPHNIKNEQLPMKKRVINHGNHYITLGFISFMMTYFVSLRAFIFHHLLRNKARNKA
jgi:hypothetical protein